MTDPQIHQVDWLEPLRSYYATLGAPLPSITVIGSQDIPEPYHRLLVHREDMTSALERYHGAAIELRLLRVTTENGLLTRQVVLILAPPEACPAGASAGNGEEPPTAAHAEKRVEFGVIRIHLDRFRPQARQMILECRRPLGRILREHNIGYISRPAAFIRVSSDAIINPFLELTGEHQLFGRYNILCDPMEHPLAEVIEILPPVATPDSRKGQS